MMLHITTACKVSYIGPAGRHTDPEVYPRPDGTVSLCESIELYLQEHQECDRTDAVSCEVLLQMPSNSTPNVSSTDTCRYISVASQILWSYLMIP